jgi:hypothetical protein
MSPRRNWGSPNPSLASECAPTPRTEGEGAHSPAGEAEGLGESQFRRLEKKLSTLPTLCYTVCLALLGESAEIQYLINFFLGYASVIVTMYVHCAVQ